MSVSYSWGMNGCSAYGVRKRFQAKENNPQIKFLGLTLSYHFMGIILSILKEYETDPPGKCCHRRDRNNNARKIFQWKFWKQKKELTHFLGHYWVYAIILVIILFYFTSSNLSYADYQ